MPELSVTNCESLTLIALERPSSLQKLLPKLASDWLMDHYVVGPENAQLKFLFDDSKIVNLAELSPVVLYGDSSVGKTALMISLAVKWSRTTEQRPLVISSGENFAKEFADAVEIDDIASFRRKYRTCRMLAIDALEQLLTKSAAQEELAATMDTLVAAGVPILVTANQLPAVAKNVCSQLASRLSGGFSMRISRPSASTRNALIEALASAVEPSIASETLIQLVNHLPNPNLLPFEIRDLITIAQQNLASKGKLDPAIVSTLLRQHVSTTAPDLSTITKAVCRKLGVRLISVRGASREASIMRARALSIYLGRKLTSLSLMQIGEYFSGRDHSTILHSIRKVESLLDSDSSLANLCREIEAELTGDSAVLTDSTRFIRSGS